jgi:hypothetical protein
MPIPYCAKIRPRPDFLNSPQTTSPGELLSLQASVQRPFTTSHPWN